MIDIASNPIIPHMFRDGVAADRMRPRSVSYLPGRIREIRDSDRCGTPVLLDRPRTRHDAERLRLLYRRIGRDCMRTTSSARTGLIGLPHYVDGGRPAYVVTGIVSDVHFDRDGRLDRICLLDPCAIDPYGGGTAHIDTHIWLFADRLVVADPAMIRDHAGLGDDLLTVSLGDRITFHCYLNAYRKGARKRIGIDEWFPIDSQLYYADRNGTRRRVPNHIRDGLEIMGVRPCREVACASEQDWASRLLAALSRHLEQEGGFYEYASVKTLMPLITAQRSAA